MELEHTVMKMVPEVKEAAAVCFTYGMICLLFTMYYWNSSSRDRRSRGTRSIPCH